MVSNRELEVDNEPPAPVFLHDTRITTNHRSALSNREHEKEDGVPLLPTISSAVLGAQPRN
jgi:hypothetical protein